MTQLYATLVGVLTTLGGRFHRDDEGATAVEYGLMVALIAVAIFVTVSALGVTLDGLFQAVDDCLSGAGCVAP
ncbi:MAG: Flp family type IVb pilin [Actinomycetota bacterium]|nr:Flp family type IVb pilin [Actinomycetota bacterium]